MVWAWKKKFFLVFRAEKPAEDGKKELATNVVKIFPSKQIYYPNHLKIPDIGAESANFGKKFPGRPKRRGNIPSAYRKESVVPSGCLDTGPPPTRLGSGKF